MFWFSHREYECRAGVTPDSGGILRRRGQRVIFELSFEGYAEVHQGDKGQRVHPPGSAEHAKANRQEAATQRSVQGTAV